MELKRYIAGVLAGVTAVSTAACSKVEDEIVVEEPIERVEVVRNFDYPSDEQISDRLYVFGDLDTTMYPKDIYKVLEIADSNQFYRVIVVKGRVDYIEENGKIKEVYTISYAFSVDDLFTTTDLDNFSDAEYKNEILNGGRILTLSPIDKLGDIAMLFGASDEYVDSVLNKELMSDMTVAIAYVSLIPNTVRITPSDLKSDIIVIK